jgi:hypothetical protein
VYADEQPHADQKVMSSSSLFEMHLTSQALLKPSRTFDTSVQDALGRDMTINSLFYNVQSIANPVYINPIR